MASQVSPTSSRLSSRTKAAQVLSSILQALQDVRVRCLGQGDANSTCKVRHLQVSWCKLEVKVAGPKAVTALPPQGEHGHQDPTS